ncbi:hypothetical protein FRC03_000042 [Tulasnella sp. 419]|nr:hypothetical protein FRC03_000042 [Tulasnella sp. 419]
MTLLAKFEEILLIRDTLLPGEVIRLEDDITLCDDHNRTSPSGQSSGLTLSEAFDAYRTSGHLDPKLDSAQYYLPLTFDIITHGITINVTLQPSYPDDWSDEAISINLRSGEFSKVDHKHWKDAIDAAVVDARSRDDDRYLVFHALCDTVLPQIANDAEQRMQNATMLADPPLNQSLENPCSSEYFHTLFTSHHLVSTQKRKSLSNWCSGSSTLRGYAKVGYPGIIYVEGSKEEVSDFTQNVKSMQWLALRLRFAEALLEEERSAGAAGSQGGRWKELEKVGEVVDEMRRMGREKYILDLGIGSGPSRT